MASYGCRSLRLERVDPFGEFRFARLETIRLAAFIGQSFEVRGLHPGHRIVADTQSSSSVSVLDCGTGSSLGFAWPCIPGHHNATPGRVPGLFGNKRRGGPGVPERASIGLRARPGERPGGYLAPRDSTEPSGRRSCAGASGARRSSGEAVRIGSHSHFFLHSSLPRARTAAHSATGCTAMRPRRSVGVPCTCGPELPKARRSVWRRTRMRD
jgi:hypothetical protein